MTDGGKLEFLRPPVRLCRTILSFNLYDLDCNSANTIVGVPWTGLGMDVKDHIRLHGEQDFP